VKLYGLNCRCPETNPHGLHGSSFLKEFNRQIEYNTDQFKCQKEKEGMVTGYGLRIFKDLPKIIVGSYFKSWNNG
jgi:hypothetical protein